jgi:PDZ domain-containing protein
MSVLAAIAVVILLIGLVGRAVRLPYYTIAPGSALDLVGGGDPSSSRISIHGAKTYPTDDQIMLLFVRESARVNVWQWIRASLDPNIDLFKEQQFTGGLSPEEVQVQSDADMARSQLAAKKVALQAAGFTVPAAPGVVVLAVEPSRPAASVLRTRDVILAVDGKKLTSPNDLSAAIRAHKPGSVVELTVSRDGKQRKLNVKTEAGDDGASIIGVIVSGQYQFPIDVNVDTSQIGGPSAGLAMTLSIFDKLTPGNLAGGKKVAVTGTISEDGSVGEIGGITQKAGSAKAAGADLFIVPACTTKAIKASCESDLAKAKKRAGSLRVVPVATFDQALEVLRANGGDPVTIAARPAA